MSFKNETRIDEVRERIGALAARTRESEASTRAKVVAAYEAEEAAWNAAYMQLENEIVELAADIGRTNAELESEFDADLADAMTEFEQMLDSIEVDLDRLDDGVAAKEHRAAERVRASVAKLRNARDAARRELRAAVA